MAAYDRIAPAYAGIAGRRRAYLDAVDRLIIAAIPPCSRSLLDVGAANGERTLRIAAAAHLSEITLLEPSGAMRSLCPSNVSLWPLRAEQLGQRQGSFDVITCLWNVLGHILPAAARAETLRQFARLVSPQGRIFLDVSHRYNARHYGAFATTARFLRDRLSPPGRNGDVKVVWDVDGRPCATTGHVFTHPEIAALCRDAGLDIVHRLIVDYSSGEIRRWSFEGNLIYVLRRR